jgi:UDP-N-acetyl-D-glucosamine dehydrogenase
MTIDAAAIAEGRCVVAVCGLGYVGLPLALAFADAGLRVIGLDIDPAKPAAITQGRSYLRHIPSSRLAGVVAAGRLTATTAFTAVAGADAVIICVPTPLDAHLVPDLTYVENTSRDLAPHLAPGTLVVLESTTWPGTTAEVVRPLIEAAGRVGVGRGLYLCYSPEREDPGNPRWSTRTIPKLIGGIDAESLALGVALYRRAIETVVAVDDLRVAEAAKLLENIFRSVNIALVNELKTIFDRMGIDVWKVIAAAGTKPFGFMPFSPGPGLGGHCIPIDPFYLAWKAREFGLNARFIELAGEVNRAMPAWVVGKVQDCLNDHGKSLKGSRVLVIGLAYKADVDDIRESPSLLLIELLEAKGARADYHDPHVPVIPPTREHGTLAGRASAPLGDGYDCFLVATAHKVVPPETIVSFGVPVVDTRNCCGRGPGIYPA